MLPYWDKFTQLDRLFVLGRGKAMHGKVERRLAASAMVAVVGALAAALVSCSRGPEALCESSAVEDKVFALAREQYPNKASNELMGGHGGVRSFERILKEQNLDRNKLDDLHKAAMLGNTEAKRVYQEGRYKLEDVSVIEQKTPDGSVRCGGRMVFFTSWGIVVRNVTYDVKPKGDSFDMELYGLQ
jgi:hypothetical protein